MSGIHLFVPMLHRRDAVGEHTRALHRQLVDRGWTCRIYSETVDPETVDETTPFGRYEADAEPGDVLVYQVATASAIPQWLAQRPETVVLNYHSITPARFFAPWNNDIARRQEQAIAELRLLAPKARLGIGVSEYDVAELGAAGCADTRVIPVANVAVPSMEPDPEVLGRLGADSTDRGPHWLSVGRLAPNKAHHRTIAALFDARSTSMPGAHLTIVGSAAEPSYARALHRFVDALELQDAVSFASGLSDAALAAYYRSADVLVMCSEHEGFGVPLVEAMGQGLPVVAVDAGAVAEVLGDAGVLLHGPAPREVARAIEALLSDAPRRTALADAGRRRFASLGLDRAGSDLADALIELVDEAPTRTAGSPSAR